MLFVINWLDVVCRVGTTVSVVIGGATIGAVSGAISGSVGGPVGAASGAIAGTGLGIATGVATSGTFCDQAAHDMYMRQKCQTLANGDMYVKLNGKQLATVKSLSDLNMMPASYYKDLGACQEGGYLPKDPSTGMTLP